MDIVLGALAPSLARQLAKDSAKIQALQRDADAITRLAVRDILTETAAARARSRLVKAIARALDAEE